MKDTDLIAGLQLLQPFYTKPDGYNCGAEHDILYAYATDKPLPPELVAKMIELGWVQEECGEGGEFTAADYDPDESWGAYV